jgi:hypothetical protein
MRLIMLVEDTPEELPMGVFDSWGEMTRHFGVNSGYFAIMHKRDGTTNIMGQKARVRTVEVDDIADYQQDGKERHKKYSGIKRKGGEA